ncbi:hypothetical protein [Bradyrhizobium sp. SRS-191]|uniref:hypothetical protein n=1 Tax=Bradyrhizobium sp. SRS-191 TaxID=2962606 RepID=UPI00211E71D9|nr:hypothetical protein [Bradyrhizobium sp. SRS-191]
MSKRTNSILTLSNKRGVDLLAPKAGDIDFGVLAEHLAKTNRYNGATPGVAYSVADHCVIGASEIMQQEGDYEIASYFLLHDGHEAFLGDDTTPKKRAIAVVAEQAFGVLASSVMEAFDQLADRFDAAIHEAAGLAWPPSPDMKLRIKHWDLRMFVTEWRDLMRGVEHPDPQAYAGIPLLDREIHPQHWVHARNQFADYVHLLLDKRRASR